MGRIIVNIANGSVGDIWCKLNADKRQKTSEAVNAWIKTNALAGLNTGVKGGRTVSYEWSSLSEAGYTKVGSGKVLKFSQIADGGCVYLSITGENNDQICDNYVLTSNENVILDIDCDIKIADKGNVISTAINTLVKGRRQNKWIDEDGIDHKKILKIQKAEQISENKLGKLAIDDQDDDDDEDEQDDDEKEDDEENNKDEDAQDDIRKEDAQNDNKKEDAQNDNKKEEVQDNKKKEEAQDDNKAEDKQENDEKQDDKATQDDDNIDKKQSPDENENKEKRDLEEECGFDEKDKSNAS